MTNVYASNLCASYSCGLEIVGDFTGAPRRWDWESRDRPQVQTIRGTGTGLVLAAFVDTPVCRKAYEKITEKWPVLYQSPRRRNRNSGRDFFFIIYDTR